jgi:hypothetical protein
MLRVSANRRFLVHDDGTPFFYLGDTAWELFHRLTREEAAWYLRNRAEKRFSVIQAVILAEYSGLTEPNRYGALPLYDNDPARPNEAYFAHVDQVVDTAAGLGLWIGMLPTWGDKVNQKWGMGPEIFTPQNAAVYGEFLGRRYGDKPVIWILGGDRPCENDTHTAIWRAMAAGVRNGDGGRNLITYHPSGGHSSAEYVLDEPWLDFNMLQSGHDYDRDNYNRIAADYARVPTRPCLDGEPGYEDHPAAFKHDNGYLDDYEARKFAYWALFAGAHGHTYGCHDIWQFFDPERHPPVTFARTHWREAIDLPGAGQMRHARALLESRPFLSRVPDQTLLASDAGAGSRHIQATRDHDGSYALIYSAAGLPFDINLERLAGDTLRATWFDPRTGTATASGAYARAGTREFTPPSSGPGNDWVLVLDDSARGYALP